MNDSAQSARSFESFHRAAETRLRHALVARYGPEVGREVAAEALLSGWEHWDRVGAMDNPTGYLFRVGQSRARRHRRNRRVFAATPADHEPEFEPRLVGALASLSERQRTVVVLVHSYGWTLSEVAEFLGVGLTTAQKHEERGLRRLRNVLEVDLDA